jgi:ABC-type sugar transport system ATPase subunit
MATVELKQVDKAFGNVEAIHDLNLSIADGEFVALVGPSGCGKSTTLRMIAGLESVSRGAIVIGERDVSCLPARDRDIAMVFQSYALYPHMTVAQNVGFGLKLRGVKAPRVTELVDEAARTLQLKDLLDRRPKELSGGQRQRVAMGRAMVRHPKVFLFDEPLSNLDAKLRVHMRAEIKKLHRQLATTTIYVTHDQTEAMTLADRIVVMNRGRIEQVGTPHELYSAPVSQFVAGFIGSPEMNFLDAVVDQAAGICGLRFSDGSRLSLGSERAGLESGRSVTLGVRPEHLRLASPGDPADSQIRGVIEVVEPLGADTLVHAAVAGRTLIARVAAEAVLCVGDSIHLNVDRTRAHLFAPATGLAL